jgi:hypothetical protein
MMDVALVNDGPVGADPDPVEMPTTIGPIGVDFTCLDEVVCSPVNVVKISADD